MVYFSVSLSPDFLGGSPKPPSLRYHVYGLQRKTPYLKMWVTKSSVGGLCSSIIECRNKDMRNDAVRPGSMNVVSDWHFIQITMNDHKLNNLNITITDLCEIGEIIISCIKGSQIEQKITPLFNCVGD